MPVTPSVAMASRLATAIGTMAIATAIASGLGDLASRHTPYTATAKSASHASRTSTTVLPCARVHTSLQKIGLPRIVRASRPRPATRPREASCERFQRLTERIAAQLAATTMAAETARNATTARPAPGEAESDSNTARAGETPPPAAGPATLRTASPAATHATSRKRVMAMDWKVVSFQKATAVAMLPAARLAPSVTRKSRASWAAVTPPKSATTANTGIAATIRSTTCSRLPPSFPTTSSRSERSLTRSISSVRRSFSALTEIEASTAEADTARASCSGARIFRSVAPNRAASPTVSTDCEAVTTSQQVATMATSRPA